MAEVLIHLKDEGDEVHVELTFTPERRKDEDPTGAQMAAILFVEYVTNELATMRQ